MPGRRRYRQVARRARVIWGAVLGVAPAAALGQLDKGHQILLEKGFQIDAMAVDQPEIPNWSVFDAGGWNGVDFQFNYFAPSEYLGPAPGNHVWQASYSDYSHTSFTSVEAPYAANCVRIQLMDEQDLNDSTVRANTAAWFAAARTNYPNTILSVNQVAFQTSDANFRDFMQTSQPDMLMIDSYRWLTDPNQGSWNLFSDWQRTRNFALGGNDGTGSHPIPYGFYAQAVDDFPPGEGRVPSESELRFEHFGAWAMGYTMTDDFTYNTNESYSGVESIFFVNGSQQANPTASYYQVQSINAEGKNLGPALVRLLSTDVRFVAGENASGATNPNPISISNWSQGAGGDAYLRSYSRVNVGTKNNGNPGDVLLTWFKPLDESFDSDAYSGEKYFAVFNGLTDPNGSAADCAQLVQLTYDFGTSGIRTLERLRRDTGQVEVVPMTQLANGQYTVQVTLDGGTMDLFKFNDGSPFVGIAASGLKYWDADGSAAGNDSTSGAGLGGSGTWDASAARWFDADAGTNGAHSAIGNAVFAGAAGTVSVASPLTINALSFKSSGYTIAGSTLTLSSSFVSVDAGVSATINSSIAGSAGLTKTGGGTLILGGANSYSGATIVNGGMLAIAGDGSLGAVPGAASANLMLNNNSTLRFNGATALDANRMVTLGNAATFDTSGNDATIAGQISGTASLTKTGNGALALTNSNSYTGGTIINGGTLEIASDASLGAVPASLGAGNIVLDNGATLRFGANLDISSNRGITINVGGGNIDTQGFVSSSGYSAVGGFQGAGNLTKLGSGTFYCTSTTGNNSWTGSLILKQGIWKTTSRGGFPINPTSGGLRAAQTIFDGGTLQFAANLFTSEPNRGITINAGGGTIDTQGFNVTWAGPISGSSSSAILTKSGAGLLQLNSSSVASNYAGTMNVAAGTLLLSGGKAMGDSAAVVLANAAGAKLVVSGNETIGSLAGGGNAGGTVSLGGSTLTTGGNNASTTFAGVITGTTNAKLVKTGSGAMVLIGDQRSTTNLSISDGEVDMQARGDGAAQVLEVRTLSVATGSKLDLNDNDLVVDAGSFSTIQGLVFQGYRTSSDPSATGIVSSTGQTSVGNPILALFDNALVHSADYPFGSGKTISANAVVGKYTYFGDTNLDGQVTADDYGALDANYGATSVNAGAAWVIGDTNFDGSVTADDYGALDANFGLGVGNPLGAEGVAAVPEVSSVLGVGMVLGLIAKRRQRASA